MDLAKNEGKDFFEIMNAATETVNDTLYSYSKENKGAKLQGGAARVLLQFQHYRIMTGLRMAMLFKNSILFFRSDSIQKFLTNRPNELCSKLFYELLKLCNVLVLSVFTSP